MPETFDPVADVCGRIEFAKMLYIADLKAMPTELLEKEWGGKTRNGFDMTYEAIGLCRALVEILGTKGGDLEGPSSGGGWTRAPKEFYDQQKAIAEFEAAVADFITAFKSYNGSIYTDQYSTPIGPMTPLAMANVVVAHTSYHSGQLNYIQTLAGDDDFHWFGK